MECAVLQRVFCLAVVTMHVYYTYLQVEAWAVDVGLEGFAPSFVHHMVNGKCHHE